MLTPALPRPQLAAQRRLLAVRVAGCKMTMKSLRGEHHRGEERYQDGRGAKVHEDDR